MRRVITCLLVALMPLWAANAQPLKPKITTNANHGYIRIKPSGAKLGAR